MPPLDNHFLPFEKPIHEIEAKINEFEQLARVNDLDFSEEIAALRTRRENIIRDVFSKLTPYQRVLLSRHEQRPQSADYIERIFGGFMELAGDRLFGDDRAVITGFGKLEDWRVMVVAQQKGRNLAERQLCNFGYMHPEGYRKVLAKMRLAEKFGLPIISLIDTKGAYPGVGAEERGQSVAIAENLRHLFTLRVPIIGVVIGEGGSGGALAVGIADHLSMMENSYLSVIAPEGCATILWRSRDKASEAAAALKITPQQLKDLGLIDEILPEPPGGAHRHPDTSADILKAHLLRVLDDLSRSSVDEMIPRRYDKYRAMGVFMEEGKEKGKVV